MVLATHSVGGEESRVKPLLFSFFRHRFVSDAEVVGLGTDLKGRRGIYRVNTRTGSALLLVPDGTFPLPSRDGSRLAYAMAKPDGGFSLIVRDTATGTERSVIGPGADLSGYALSPDGRTVAYVDRDQRVASVVTADGGLPRELFRVNTPERLITGQVGMQWTPDQRYLVLGRVVSENSYGWVGIPMDGGRVVDIALPSGTARPTASQLGTLSIHPDGQRIAYNAGEAKYETWILENFIPKTAK